MSDKFRKLEKEYGFALAAVALAEELPPEFWETLTLDQGLEIAEMSLPGSRSRHLAIEAVLGRELDYGQAEIAYDLCDSYRQKKQALAAMVKTAKSNSQLLACWDRLAEDIALRNLVIERIKDLNVSFQQWDSLRLKAAKHENKQIQRLCLEKMIETAERHDQWLEIGIATVKFPDLNSRAIWIILSRHKEHNFEKLESVLRFFSHGLDQENLILAKMLEKATNFNHFNLIWSKASSKAIKKKAWEGMARTAETLKDKYVLWCAGDQRLKRNIEKELSESERPLLDWVLLRNHIETGSVLQGLVDIKIREMMLTPADRIQVIRYSHDQLFVNKMIRQIKNAH